MTFFSGPVSTKTDPGTALLHQSRPLEQGFPDMATRAIPAVLKTLLWMIGILLAIGLAGVTWVAWRVYSFDTATLPERHGQVDAHLYAPPGPPRPLIVGLGGAEGGNSWTRENWRTQRDRFQHQG